MVYDLYDEWKKQCGVGRLVDLDGLLRWVEERAGDPTARKKTRRRAVKAGSGRSR